MSEHGLYWPIDNPCDLGQANLNAQVCREEKAMASDSFWDRNDLDRKVTEVLADVPLGSNDHFGRQFLTAYQLAILFKVRFPEVFQSLGQPLGGVGTGERNSFAQYLAGQLAIKIRNQALPDIEGASLSNERLTRVEFNDDEGPVVSSLTGSGFPLSMFRYKG